MKRASRTEVDGNLREHAVGAVLRGEPRGDQLGQPRHQLRADAAPDEDPPLPSTGQPRS